MCKTPQVDIFTPLTGVLHAHSRCGAQFRNISLRCFRRCRDSVLNTDTHCRSQYFHWCTTLFAAVMHAVYQSQLRRPCSDTFDDNNGLLYYITTYTRSLRPQTTVSQSAVRRRHAHLCEGASARRRNRSVISRDPLDASTLPRTAKPLVPCLSFHVSSSHSSAS